eukprot:Pgem_evm1s14641
MSFISQAVYHRPDSTPVPCSLHQAQYRCMDKCYTMPSWAKRSKHRYLDVIHSDVPCVLNPVAYVSGMWFGVLKYKGGVCKSATEDCWDRDVVKYDFIGEFQPITS